MAEPMAEGLADPDLPALFTSADRNSLIGQRRALSTVRTRLALLVVAAVAGTFGWHAGPMDVAGFVGAVALGGTLVTEVYLLTARPERMWYDGRAVAESVKSLAWRFAVGGNPVAHRRPPLIGVDTGARDMLLRRFGSLIREMGDLHLIPRTEGIVQITAAMQRARELPLAERQRLYLRGRVLDQQRWYAAKAAWNERQAVNWQVALATAEAAGLAGAVLKAASVLSVDTLGIFSALTAAGPAWLQTKQHHNLARAYAVASQELADIAAMAERAFTEREWAEFAADAEDAISREHRLWRATHA
ncbi:DUF4231 domain-containing protein [Spirillospora sp. NPDC049024]